MIQFLAMGGDAGWCNQRRFAQFVTALQVIPVGTHGVYVCGISNIFHQFYPENAQNR